MEKIVYEPIAYFIPEFCVKFVISKSAFYREVRAKRLRLYKRGKRSLIEKAEADRWFASLTGRPSQEKDGARAT